MGRALPPASELVDYRPPPGAAPRFPLTGRAAVAKRGLDLLGALAVLAVTAPLWLLIAAAIKLTSRGPVFFRQARVGQGGELFTLLKFRSMRPETPPDVRGARVPPDAVYPLGRWLRRSSLDELPQLLNVLRGEMSLVGPRPELPGIVAGYDELAASRRLARPGLTGLWQVTADRSAPILDAIGCDLYYVYEYRWWLDALILMRTPRAMLRGA
jgi:lipopolysaccharide/colanic/teichoic acid biosynthesis glycosyltransferase